MAEGGESEVKVKAEPGNGAGSAAGDASQKTGLTEAMEEVLEYEDRIKNIGLTRTRLEVQAMPTRLYLDYTVVPILLDGMTAVDRTRPPDPIEYLAAFLMKNKEKYTPRYKPESGP